MIETIYNTIKEALNPEGQAGIGVFIGEDEFAPLPAPAVLLEPLGETLAKGSGATLLERTLILKVHCFGASYDASFEVASLVYQAVRRFDVSVGKLQYATADVDHGLRKAMMQLEVKGSSQQETVLAVIEKVQVACACCDSEE